MKPCFGNRKQLALLAIGGLTRGREITLRAHLEACPGCRAYLAEISGVAGKLKAIEPSSEIRASDDFHRKVTSQLPRSLSSNGREEHKWSCGSVLGRASWPCEASRPPNPAVNKAK